MSRPTINFWIVDDDLSFGKSLKRTLNARGFQAEFFGSAQSFLDSVPPGESGCAIVDIHMPGCDGFELLKKMQERHYGIFVIIITGHMDSQARDLAMQNGAAGYLQKPFCGESLLELVHKLETDRLKP